MEPNSWIQLDACENPMENPMIWDDFGMIWGAPILGFLMVSLGMTSE